MEHKMARWFSDDYEEKLNCEVSPGFNAIEVDEVDEYCKKHLDEFEITSRFDDDLRKLQELLKKLKKQGVILENGDVE
jgi:DNA-binding transcriptional regulator GbsR (MarR family)